MKDFSQSLFRSVVPAILLALLTGGVVLDVLITERLEEDFDELILAKSLGLIALAEDGDDGVEMENYEVTLPSYALQENADYFQLITDDGEVLISSSSLSFWTGTAHPLPRLYERDTQDFLNITLPDGRPGRLLRKRFVPRLDFEENSGIGFELEMDARFLDFPGKASEKLTELITNPSSPDAQPLSIERQPLTLQLAMGRDSLDSLVYKVHSVLILTGLSIMALIVLLARRGINKAVQPLRAMADELHDIDAQRFDQRLHATTSVTELDNLTQSINVLLSRIESAFDRERRFSGDVAHELRTPLAELRTLLDVADRWPDDPAIKDSFNTDVRDVTDRMQRIVETLLKLSRSEQGSDMLVQCSDLNELVRKCIGRIEASAKDNQIALVVELADTPLVCVGLDQWQSIVANLIENAVEYAPQGSHVGIRLTLIEKGRFRFSVDNDVHDLIDADLDNMFERLWRKDASRTSGLHSGLGLALVHASCNQVGAQIESRLEQRRLTIMATAALLQPGVSSDGLPNAVGSSTVTDPEDSPAGLLAIK